MFILLFVGWNVFSFAGMKFIPVMMTVVFLSLLCMYCNRQSWMSEKINLCLVCYAIIFLCWAFLLKKVEGPYQWSILLVGGITCFFSLPNFKDGGCALNDWKLWKKLWDFFIAAFLLEVGIAVIEKGLGVHIIGYRVSTMSDATIVLSNLKSAGFRSVGLYGHPLYNALMVSIAINFILVSQLKAKYKIALWSLGFLAILCFNARGCIVLNAFIMIAYMMYLLIIDKKISKKAKRSLLVSGGGAIIFFLFSMVYWKLGDRLLSIGLYDEQSASVRVNVYDLFKYFDWNTFLFGHSSAQVSSMMRHAGLFATENFWIDFILHIGLVFFAPYVILVTLLVGKLLKNYKRMQKLFLGFSFLISISTFNSLSSQFLALFYFLLLTRLFDPLYNRNFIKQKYLMG